jgi:hypothetical protein
VIRFWCSERLRRAAKKSRHRVVEQCESVLRVLALHPTYGPIVAGHAPLRKMRIAIPSAAFGKRGGYRMIYREAMLDQARHVLLLRVYYKGDRDDLDPDGYREAWQEAEDVLQDVLSHDFLDVDPPAP